MPPDRPAGGVGGPTTVEETAAEKAAREKAQKEYSDRQVRLAKEEAARKAAAKAAADQAKHPEKTLKKQREDELARLRKLTVRTDEQQRRMQSLIDTLHVRSQPLDDLEGRKARSQRGVIRDGEIGRIGSDLFRTGLQAQAAIQKADTIRQAFGMRPMVQAGFLEEIRDPNTQDLTGYQVPVMLQGYRFGPQLQGGQYMAGSNLSSSGPSVTALSGMSVNEMLTFYNGLNDKELARFQNDLVNAGLINDVGNMRLGMRDEETQTGLANLMTTWAANPNMSLSQLMDKLRTTYNAKVSDLIRSNPKLASAGTGTASDLVKNITYTSGDQWNSVLDTVGQQLYGEYLPPEVKANLIAQLQEKEKRVKTDAIMKDAAAVAANTKPSELDAFMQALIGQESGGDPNVVNSIGAFGLGQMMNWAGWAREAGQDPGDKSAENQKRVIQYKLAKYYQAYGNWRDVAIAWYAGEYGQSQVKSGAWSGNAPEDGGPTINGYADQMMARFNSILGSGLADAAAAPKVTVNAHEDLASPEMQAQATLKALDPARYAGTQFAKRAGIFFNLIKGVQ